VSPAEIWQLQQAIKRLHGCDSRHLEGVSVHETFKGQTVWQGMVQVFEVIGHPRTSRAYAWNHASGPDDKDTRFVAVLGIPPVDTPQDAVRASIVAESKSRK